ncbi:MAG: nucleotidyltransferase domain-containing protein [bacterium]|nr:nucleotidyltransferase domain-containing protein [bacterium]
MRILADLKKSLIARFGNDINSVILFGSRATGNAHKNSDYDVLIILNNDYNWRYKREITGVVYLTELEHEIFIDTKIISANELYNTVRGKQSLYVDALEQGIRA